MLLLQPLSLFVHTCLVWRYRHLFDLCEWNNTRAVCASSSHWSRCGGFTVKFSLFLDLWHYVIFKIVIVCLHYLVQFHCVILLFFLCRVRSVWCCIRWPSIISPWGFWKRLCPSTSSIMDPRHSKWHTGKKKKKKLWSQTLTPPLCLSLSKFWLSSLAII